MTTIYKQGVKGSIYAMYANDDGAWKESASVKNNDLINSPEFGLSRGGSYFVKIEDDAVNKPSHYMLFDDGTEAIDVIRKQLTDEEFNGYLKGNFLKYRLRAGDKDDLKQDIDKSNWYKSRLNKELNK